MTLLTNPDSPADRLRLATWPRHQRIEKCGLIKRVFSKDYQLGEYATLLERIYGFYSAVEPLLAAALADERESLFRRPSKTPLLLMDLQGLERWRSSGPSRALPVCIDLPQIKTPEDAIGVSYVLEGATMGGSIISKHLAGHFGDAAAMSLGFYRSYDEDTVPKWMAYKRALNQRFADDEAGIANLIRAADATYLSFTDWLEQTVWI